MRLMMIGGMRGRGRGRGGIPEDGEGFADDEVVVWPAPTRGFQDFDEPYLRVQN